MKLPIEDIVADYNSGMSQLAVADKYMISVPTLLKYMAASGLPVRASTPHGERRKDVRLFRVWGRNTLIMEGSALQCADLLGCDPATVYHYGKQGGWHYRQRLKLSVYIEEAGTVEKSVQETV